MIYIKVICAFFLSERRREIGVLLAWLGLACLACLLVIVFFLYLYFGYFYSLVTGELFFWIFDFGYGDITFFFFFFSFLPSWLLAR